MMDFRRYHENIAALDQGTCGDFDHTVIALYATWLELQEYTLREGLAHLVEYSIWLGRWGIPPKGVQRQIEFIRERGRLALEADDGTR